jgi:methyltransferase-like protein/trans-aconitate methyltransferase
MTQESVFSYDVVPYESDTHKVTRPDHLATVARLFGVDAPDFRNARILELGCAGGGNLIPMAAAYPESQFVGIDLSEGHISDAEKLSTGAELTNVRFHCVSITDVDASFGTFDYIIAHGVYAWVPEDVRNRIFSICQNNLSPNGLAYISYNTLPGWNMVKTVRDMMIYHAELFDDPATKIREARQMVQFAANNAVSSDPIYKQMLEREVSTISEGSDDYVFHDHMAPLNDPSYFRDFMALASENGLQYLGDCHLPTMYLGNFSAQTRETLGQIDDIVRQEQYLDFLTNRRFRNTILCRAELSVDRGITTDRLKSLCFGTVLAPKGGLSNVDLSVDGPTEFVHSSSATSFVANNRRLAAAFCVLSEQFGLPCRLEDLVAKACVLLSNESEENIQKEFLQNVVTLMLSGALEVYGDPGGHTPEVSSTPEVWPLARFFAGAKPRVPNLLHNGYDMGDDLRAMVPYADGSRTIDQITEALLVHFLDGRLSFRLDDKLITDEETLTPLLKSHVQGMLKFLGDRAFLVS